MELLVINLNLAVYIIRLLQFALIFHSQTDVLQLEILSIRYFSDGFDFCVNVGQIEILDTMILIPTRCRDEAFRSVGFYMRKIHIAEIRITFFFRFDGVSIVVQCAGISFPSYSLGKAE